MFLDPYEGDSEYQTMWKRLISLGFHRAHCQPFNNHVFKVVTLVDGSNILRWIEEDYAAALYDTVEDVFFTGAMSMDLGTYSREFMRALGDTEFRVVSNQEVADRVMKKEFMNAFRHPNAEAHP